MKRLANVIVAASAAIFALSSCAGTYKKGDRMPDTTDAQIDTISYALGMYYGKMLTSTPMGEVNLAQVRKGFNDVLNDKDPILDENELGMRIQSYIRNRMAFEADRSLEEGNAFLAANKEKEGVVETESGLQYLIEIEGTGISPEPTDTVEVNYEGRLIDGTVFDSSYERGETAKFPLTMVIPGWSEGLGYAKEGGRIQIVVPAELGYGSRPSGPIPGNSVLIFDVDLIKVYKAQPKENK
ncbi:MAG TPA: FKBP-type peptidyl-prolyl cis-trans isomerase [Candidatus Coprenecus stercoravium]|uniref:Peptidyl-prolyl cis-trans isomerase n=1 Tax=Candidatus Coprenecus stercoravium TaxID=2840735 RepID=A0A9D2GS69_9BACT|nr:FKBP-type peptidyl-prolyl cis-trans isomerase [Candidatus Coprenecus stercoravium]